MKLRESGEMYLKTIYSVSQRCAKARAIDVAKELDVTGASVCRAVQLLQESGFLTRDSGRSLRLTANGTVRAQQILERHTVLTAFLKMLGVPDPFATDDACKMEHYLSEVTIQAIRRQLDQQKI